MSHSTFLQSTFNAASTFDADPSQAPATSANTDARWPWIAIAACALMFVVVTLNQFSHNRVERASQALQTTWLPAVDKLSDLQVELRDLADAATRSGTWTPGQLRGRITDHIQAMSTWLALHQQDIDDVTPEKLQTLKQRWADYLATPDEPTGTRMARLQEALTALEQLTTHCLAQSRAQADIAAGH